ncbi:MAG: HNH endonuclease, partial [Actinomycetota bacterium]|nr:HNH endonuclease [Actinomycetota bacterium]
MEQLATRSLQIGTEHVTGRAGKFRIYLHLDTDAAAWTHKAGALPEHLRRKWTCDGSIQPIWETHGTPINVGRAQRIVPDHTRRLIEDRDRGCTYPGCLAIHHLECHHIVHWADGGTTTMNNLISLCPHHHDRHHLGDFTIHPITTKPGQSSQFEFRTRGGRSIEPVTATPTPTAEPGNGNWPTDDTDPTDLSEPPRYIGPTNEVLHLDWVRFYRRPPSTDDEDKGNNNGVQSS